MLIHPWKTSSVYYFLSHFELLPGNHRFVLPGVNITFPEEIAVVEEVSENVVEVFAAYRLAVRRLQAQISADVAEFFK